MEIEELPLDDLVLDQNLNLRDRLDDEAIERYAEAWERIPPVTVFEVEGQWLLTDGFHRHAAALARSRPTIRAEVRHGSFDEALEFAAGANLAHGLPLNRAERRRAVEIKLRMHHDWSDRRLADELGVSRDLIGKVRKQLVESKQIPAIEGRIGTDGKTYPAISQGLPRDPNEHRPRGPALAQQDEPSARPRGPAPWEDASDASPPQASPKSFGANASGLAPWEGVPGFADAKALARAGPVEVSTPTIDEMLNLMARQIMEVVTWVEAEDFKPAYQTAGEPARNLFQASVRALAERAETLRAG